MLDSKTEKRIIKKNGDWYPTKTYVHFDMPLNRKAATALVISPSAVEKHHFLPLISFEKIERRFRRSKNGALPQGSPKIRQLAYCSNIDAEVFSYYAQELNKYYEDFIHKVGIEKNVIGYRKVGSNIALANDAFSEIRSRGSCVAFAFDISGFFDNIDHLVLKRNWEKILGKDQLPDDHYQVFKHLTKFSTVNRAACLRRLGFKPTPKNRDLPKGPLCSIMDFRNKIRGKDTQYTSLVIPWKRNYRIPQGTPLSALAANISMIEFDIFMRCSIDQLGGSYRRYSDDILIIVPSTNRNFIETNLKKALRKCTKRLYIKDKKTSIVEFIPGALAAGRGTKALQYLGFTFDGEKTLLRSSTISKFYRRMFRGIGAAKRQQKKAIAGKLLGREQLHKRKLFLKHSHLGLGNFLTTYAQFSQTKMAGNSIRKQIAKRTKILNSKLE